MNYENNEGLIDCLIITILIFSNNISTAIKTSSKNIREVEHTPRDFEYTPRGNPIMAEPIRNEIVINETDIHNEDIELLLDYVSHVEQNMEMRISRLESIPACGNSKFNTTVLSERIDLNLNILADIEDCDELQVLIKYVFDMEKRFNKRMEALHRRHETCSTTTTTTVTNSNQQCRI